MKICQRMYEAAADDLTKAVQEEQEEERQDQQEEGVREQEEGHEKQNIVAQEQQPEVRDRVYCLFLARLATVRNG